MISQVERALLAGQELARPDLMPQASMRSVSIGYYARPLTGRHKSRREAVAFYWEVSSPPRVGGQSRSSLKHKVDERLVDSKFVVVMDISLFPELAHEAAHLCPRGADHLGEGFMRDPGYDGRQALSIAGPG